MRTNKEKYDAILEELNERAMRYIDGIFPDGKPIVYYAIGQGFVVEAVPIKDFGYHFGFQFYPKDHPTRIEIEALQQFALTDIQFCENDVCINVEITGKWKDGSTRKSSWTMRLSQLRDPDKYGMSLQYEELKDIAARKKELYTLKDGDLACAYCRKAFPKEKAYHGHIYSIANYGVRGRDNDYCSPECHGYDQMAHEG